MLTRKRWVEIMRVSGMDEEAMMNWHRHFELMEPEAHQEFLELLQIPEEEIEQIRQWGKEQP